MCVPQCVDLDSYILKYQSIGTPSTDLREIHHRLNLVTSFLYHADLRTDLRDCLKTLPDVPRLVASVQSRPSFPSLFDLEACLHLCDTIRLTTNNYAASLPDTRSAETAAIMSFFADYPIFVQLSKQIKAVRTTEDDKEDATTLYERAIQLKGTEGAKKGKEVEGAEWAVRSESVVSSVIESPAKQTSSYNETLKKAHFAYEACAADLDGHLVSIQRKHSSFRHTERGNPLVTEQLCRASKGPPCFLRQQAQATSR